MNIPMKFHEISQFPRHFWNLQAAGAADSILLLEAGPGAPGMVEGCNDEVTNGCNYTTGWW